MERGRRSLEESIYNENHWPQLLRVRRRVSNWLLCLLCSILFVFSKRKCISKSWRKLMNYKPENRIPLLFTDFDNIKDFPWLFSYLEKFLFSLTVATLSQQFALQLAWLAQWIEHCVRSGFNSQSSLNFFYVIFFSNTLVVHSTAMIMFTFLDNLIRKTDICCRQAWNLVQKIHRKLIPQHVTLLQQR